MRPILILCLLSAATLLGAGDARADGPTPQQLQAAAAEAGSANGLCPVMGRPVTRDGGSATYQGERIAFCCKACIARFTADPVRYMDRLRLNPPKYWYVTKTPSVAAMRKAKQATGSANGRCPVMGKVVVPRGGAAVYQGQRIQFCCPPCKARFESDPERYMRMMRADPLAYAYDRPGPTNAQMRVARESVQAANGRCPVMGKLVTANGGTLTWQGQRIAFCCPPCVAKFKADPEVYMRRMSSEPYLYGYVEAGSE